MSGTKDKLKELAAKKKELNEEQKALRAEDNATKDERKKVRSTVAQNRRQIEVSKKAVRQCILDIYPTIKGVDELMTVGDLADRVIETASVLASNLRSFSENSEKLVKL